MKVTSSPIYLLNQEIPTFYGPEVFMDAYMKLNLHKSKEARTTLITFDCLNRKIRGCYTISEDELENQGNDNIIEWIRETITTDCCHSYGLVYDGCKITNYEEGSRIIGRTLQEHYNINAEMIVALSTK